MNILIFIVSVMGVLLIILFSVICYKKIVSTYYIKNYADYVAVLDYNLKKAYEIIYKDRILIYSVEATKVSDKDFNIISQDFARLVVKFLGKTIYKQLINFYGSEDTLMLNIIEYFNNTYENDEIRKRSMDEITETDTNNEV